MKLSKLVLGTILMAAQASHAQETDTTKHSTPQLDVDKSTRIEREQLIKKYHSTQITYGPAGEPMIKRICALCGMG